MEKITRQDMAALVGKHAGTSKWFVIDQTRIDSFADVTEDHQYIHVDPELPNRRRSAQPSPMGF